MEPDTQNPLDSKTTPKWLQLPGLLLLLALGGYFALANVSVYASNPPQVVLQNPYTFWFGTWKMFTVRERYHASLEVRAEVDGQWRTVDLESMFPYRWESGPRYARSVFRRSGSRMRTLAQATCQRYENLHDVRPSTLVFTEVKWRKTLGQRQQPRGEDNREQHRPVLQWSCSQAYPLPKGARL